MTRSRALLPLLLLLVATTAAAQDWRGLLESTHDDLEAGRYAQARHTTIKLINSMMDNLNRGPDAAYTMSLTVAYRAVAEAGMGNYDEADWYRHVALAMDPRVATLDFRSFGDAGTWVAAKEPDPEANLAQAGSSGTNGGTNGGTNAGINGGTNGGPDGGTDGILTVSNRQDPVCTKKRMPKYPLGAVMNKVGEPVTIHVLIDRDGTVRHPTVVTPSLAPTLIYAATEAVKTWQFQPAMADGKACPMGFDLTVNFQTQ